MPAALATLPPNCCRLSLRVHQVLAQYTAFPWPIMRSQCRRHGIDAQALTPATLGFVLRDLALGVARFRDSQAGVAAHRDLVVLLREATSASVP